MESPEKKAEPADQTFEENFKALEAIVEALDGEEPTLEESLMAYEKGITLARKCLTQLDQAELRIEELRTENL